MILYVYQQYYNVSTNRKYKFINNILGMSFPEYHNYTHRSNIDNSHVSNNNNNNNNNSNISNNNINTNNIISNDARVTSLK